MNWKRELIYVACAAAAFLLFYFLPGGAKFVSAVGQGVYLLHDYAKQHVLFCLIPAFFIAGAIEVFVSDQSVMRYLGPKAPKPVAYGVAAISGTILAVCSCTILPLFAGIYKMGAGLGPATTFLYSGPAINVLAIILSARILGLDIGLARAVGAVLASVAVGLSMAFIFRKDDEQRLGEMATLPEQEGRPLYQTVVFMATLVAILVLATWGKGTGLWNSIFAVKWWLVGVAAAALALELFLFYAVKAVWLALAAGAVAIAAAVSPVPEPPFVLGVALMSLILFYSGGAAREWLEASYILARQILPILFAGVFVAGFFLGRPGGGEGIISSHYVASLVGGNSLGANLFASVVGALMYFATLTEVPILQGLMHAGMGSGPALALLLAGPAVSLPNMLVIRSVMGTRKTLVYVCLVVVMATITGMVFGLYKG